ncbi:nuclear transport factor 2 family protein [Streptomyces sp. NPDC090088]|uniref:nuclear transport factor 2 family protein n=1 Tax=Streptomyces sp. NPDC090088 TaxID=3365944 RepID=UPI003824F57A
MTSVAEDRNEIAQLLYRYANSIDRFSAGAELDDWIATFTDDGVHEFAGVEHVGREELTVLAEQVRGIRHFILNPEIDVDGDKATVRAVQMVYQGLKLGAITWHDDDVVRTRDGWRFSRVRVARTVGGILDADNLA